MRFPQSFILFIQSINSINHLLHKLNFRITKPVLVRDVVCNSSLTTRFSTSTSRLKVKFFASSSQYLGPQPSVTRQVNMNRGPHASSKISWTGVDVSIFRVKHKILPRLRFNRVSHSFDTSRKSIKYTSDVASLLHGYDPKLILLVNPRQKSLFLIVENTSTFRPVSLHTSDLQIRISRHE